MFHIRIIRVGLVSMAVASACASSAIAPSRLAAQQTSVSTLQSHLDPARLTQVRDSFVVFLEEKESGWQRLTATSQGKQWLLSDEITINGFVHQKSVIILDAQLQERSLRQHGEMRTTPMQITLDFANGRVKGSSDTPAGGSGNAIVIDTTVASTTLDDNAVTPLLVGVRWRDSLAFTFPVLSSGKGTTSLWSFRVVGRDTTTVPAGHFETWRVEMQVDQSRSIVHITRDAPYRVVRIQNGPAFDMRLVR